MRDVTPRPDATDGAPDGPPRGTGNEGVASDRPGCAVRADGTAETATTDPAPSAGGHVTFVLDRDLHIDHVVDGALLHAPRRHWMELVDLADHGTAYAAFSRALVSHNAATCRLRFVSPWTGRTLTCTVRRDPTTRLAGGFLVRVHTP